MVGTGLIAAGALTLGAALLGSSELDHDETVQETYDVLVKNVPGDATIYADHIADGPNPRGEVAGLSYIPDLVVKSGIAHSLIIEVETAESLRDRRSEARSQVMDFRKRGYKRVLIVPPGNDDIEEVKSFIGEFDDLGGGLYAGDPDAVTEFL